MRTDPYVEYTGYYFRPPSSFLEKLKRERRGTSHSSRSASTPMASFQQQQQQGGLVGRPLVPYFDADENVNASLDAARGSEFEHMEVDARVWNKDLGYFEYPSDKPATSFTTAGSSAHGAASAPIAIPGKVLLTPAMMLSNSCPETSFMSEASHPSNIGQLSCSCLPPSCSES